MHFLLLVYSSPVPKARRGLPTQVPQSWREIEAPPAHGLSQPGRTARRCGAAKSPAGGRFRKPSRPSARRRSSFTSASTCPSSGAPRRAAPRRRSAALRLRPACRSAAEGSFPRGSGREAAGGGVRAQVGWRGGPGRLLAGRAHPEHFFAGQPLAQRHPGGRIGAAAGLRMARLRGSLEGRQR